MIIQLLHDRKHPVMQNYITSPSAGGTTLQAKIEQGPGCTQGTSPALARTN